MSDKMKIYIAAPFFNPEQLATVEAVERLLDGKEAYQYFSPRSEGILQEMTEAERIASMQRIFNSNVKEMTDCNFMIAILDQGDTGTTWELGFAYAAGKDIIGFTSNPGKQLNVMLKKCLDTHAIGLTALSSELDCYDEQGRFIGSEDVEGDGKTF
jgi:nucleoside 2-deoxyribosyltransferase